MRVLLAHPGPGFSVHDVYQGWSEGLREAGCQVVPFNLHDRLTFYDNAFFHVAEGKFRKAIPQETAVQLAINGLYAALYKVRPDLLVVVSGFLVPTDLLELARRAYGTKVAVLHTESPYEDTRQAAYAEHADVNLLNDPANIDRFPDGTYYQPHCYRPLIHRPGLPDARLAADLAFVGTGFASRMVFLEQMVETGRLEGLDVLLGGNWQALGDDSPLRKYLAHDIAECLDNVQTAQVYRSGKVGLNLYRREHEDGDDAQGWAIGPREVEMAACGMPFLRDPRGEGDDLFPRHPRFTNAAEAAEQLAWWLTNPDHRAAAASAALGAVEDRTFTHAAARLLRHIEKGQ